MWKRSPQALTIAACLLALASGAAQGRPSPLDGWWVGTYALPAKEAITFQVRGQRALVALGTGHAGAQSIAAATRRSGVRFHVPGRPPVVFTASLVGASLRGTVRQGSVHGTFVVRRGQGRALLAPGFYASGGREL